MFYNIFTSLLILFCSVRLLTKILHSKINKQIKNNALQHDDDQF